MLFAVLSTSSELVLLSLHEKANIKARYKDNSTPILPLTQLHLLRVDQLLELTRNVR